jgi:hypothetical protein
LIDILDELILVGEMGFGLIVEVEEMIVGIEVGFLFLDDGVHFF